jgi:hypothetical protein
MSAIAIVLGIVLLAGIAAGVYAVIAPRKRNEEMTLIDKMVAEPLQATTDWTNEAGDEFAGLSESARCDLIFAVAALDDDRSRQLLEHALNDPAEAVSTAAAHALATTGRGNAVQDFLERYPGPRSERISATLALLGTTTDNL